MSSISVAGDVSGAISIAAPSAAGSGVLTLPTGTDTLVGKATTDTLTNKTLVAPALGTPASGVLTNCTGVVSGALPAGSVLQVVNSQTGAVATGTTTIPRDNTIPQITEGTQFLSLAITPISATSKLLIQVNMFLSPSLTAYATAALFQDATANALAVSTAIAPAATGVAITSFNYFMTSGTTSSTTFTVRAGMQTAGTITVNGTDSTRLFGGVASTSITITEIAV